jgi:hypothetical protein
MHHFREHVRSGKITIHKVPTELQLADIATKPQPQPLFVSQREGLLQWDAEFMSREELLQPAKHLRACEVIALSLANTLVGDQHAKHTVAGEEDL